MQQTTLFAVMASLILATVFPVIAQEPAAEAEAGNDACCFTNPRYTGVCQVTTGPDESCSDVLAYLNNQASVGKTYCGNTKVRGGWTQVDCEGSSETCADSKSAR
jgi:hypothetical protein